MKKVSISIPCFNESGNVAELSNKIIEIMDGLSYEYEIVFTDNCSNDNTVEILRNIAAKNRKVKVIVNNRNYGVLDGRSDRNTSHYLTGDLIISMASDFQDPPELIPEFIMYYEQGYKVICGRKIGSEEKGKYFFRNLFYKIIDYMSDTPQHHHISGISLIDREVFDNIQYTDSDYYFRYALADMGYEVKYVDYIQNERKSGKSSYNLSRYLSYAINSMCAVSYRPLRLMTLCGLALSFLSFVIGMMYLIMKLVYWKHFQAGMAPILIGIFFLGSIQLLFIGIIGEYIGAILRKVTRKPNVVVKETINF